jgi:hypothetical protein
VVVLFFGGSTIDPITASVRQRTGGGICEANGGGILFILKHSKLN